MPVTQQDVSAAIATITSNLATLTAYVGQLEAENEALKKQLAGIDDQTRPLFGIITDYKWPNVPLSMTVIRHLQWMQDIRSRVVRVWQSVNPVTGDAYDNSDALTLASEYLTQDPKMTVIVCLTPKQNSPRFVLCKMDAIINKLIQAIPPGQRSRCHVELVNEPNKVEFWNCTIGLIGAFTQMATYSLFLQSAGFPTISPSITEPWAGNIASIQYKDIPVQVLSKFTRLGYHCYQNDPVEFEKCMVEAKKVAMASGVGGVALTEWAQMVYAGWFPENNMFASRLPLYTKAIANNTDLSCYFIGTPHWQITTAQWLIDPANVYAKSPLYNAFMTEYAKYS